MLAVMTVQLHAGHFMTAARALTRMPLARLYSTAGSASENLQKEPVGNEWNSYAQSGTWHSVMGSAAPNNIDNVRKKMRILDALIRNKKIMVPPTEMDFEAGAFGLASKATLAGTTAISALLMLDGASLLETFLVVGLLGGPVVCPLAMAALSMDYLGTKIATYRNRKAYVDYLEKVRNQYAEYLQSPEKVSEHYNAGLIEEIKDGIVSGPLPKTILNDLYAESKREGRIQE